METLTRIMQFLYPFTLISTLVLFVIWVILQRNKIKNNLVNVLTYISLALYFLSFYFNYGLQFFLIIWFLRDVFFFFVAYILIRLILKYKIITVVLIVLVAGGLGYYFFKYGNLPFLSNKVNSFETDSDAELLILVKDKNNLDKLSIVLKNWQPVIKQAFPQLVDTTITELNNYYTLNVSELTDTTEIMSIIENSGLVDDVEFNEVYTLSPIEEITPNNLNYPKYVDTLLNDPRIIDVWAFNYMNINGLFQKLKGLYPFRKAKIFILDTGIDSKHEDIGENYLSLSENYDTDTDIHGTHCAGIACAVANNKLGIASLNLTGQFTTVTSITVLPGGSGRQENIIDGIILAADNGADVISMSLGGPATEKRQKVYEKAIKYANDKGAIVIVAAGNENVNARLAVPASCKGVITVSAVDSQFEKAVFSNDVSDIEYKISAPGVNILSTTPGNDYKFLNGTSMATPYVAGLAGIMKAIQPDMTTLELYQILQNTGKDTRDTKVTGKFIQPYEAISSLDLSGFKAKALNYVGKIASFREEQMVE